MQWRAYTHERLSWELTSSGVFEQPTAVNVPTCKQGNLFDVVRIQSANKKTTSTRGNGRRKRKALESIVPERTEGVLRVHKITEGLGKSLVKIERDSHSSNKGLFLLTGNDSDTLEVFLSKINYTFNDVDGIYESVVKPQRGKGVEREKKVESSKFFNSSPRGAYVLRTHKKVLNLEKFVTQGSKVMLPAFTREDFSQRLAKLGFKDFHLEVIKLWGRSGKSQEKYLELCRHYRVNSFGRTESIPTINHVRNVIRLFKVSPLAIYDFFDQSTRTGFVEVDKLLEIVGKHQQLRSKIGIVYQGNVTSSRGMEWDVLKANDARSTASKFDLSIFALPCAVLETMLVHLDKMLVELKFPYGLPTTRVAEWLLIYGFLSNPTKASLVALNATTFIPWMAAAAGMTVAAIIDFFTSVDEGLDSEVSSDSWLQTQGVNPFDILQKAKFSPMWKKVSTMVYYIIGSTFLSGSDLGNAINGSLRLMSDFIGDGVDAVLSVNDALSYIYKRLLVVIDKGDLTEFFEPDPVTVAVLELNAYVQLLQRKDHLDPRGVLAEATLLVTRHTKNTHPLVVSACRNVFDIMNTFSSGLAEARHSPAAYIFVGLPGLGKGTMVERIAASLKAWFKIDNDINITYTYQGTKHQTLPAVSHIMLLNDFLSKKDDCSETNVLDLMQQIVDTSLLKVEAASIADKANSVLAPKLGVMTTNTMSYTFTNSLEGGPSKLNRRWEVVMFEMTPEFIKLHSNDEAKAMQAIGDNYDGSAIQFRFGKLNIPLTSKKVDFSYLGNQTIYESKIYTNPEGVVARILLQTIKKMSAPRPVYAYDCANCRLSTEFCICKVANKRCGACQLSCQHCKCSNSTALVTQGASFSLPVQVAVEADTKKFFASFKDDLIKMMENATSTDKLSVIFSELSGKLRKEIDVVSTKIENHGKTVANWVVGLGIACAIGTFIRMMLMDKQKKQGTTISSLTNVVRPDDELIPPYFGKNLPWLGNSVLHKMVHVCWDDSGPSYSIKGVWICKDLLLLPFHMLKDSHGHFGPIVIKYGNITINALLTPETFVQIENKDAMVVFVPSSVGIFEGALGKFPARSSIPTRGFCLGKEVSGLHLDSPFLISGILPDTKAGECGSVLFDQSGMIYGLFIGYNSMNDRRIWTALSQVDISRTVQALREKGILVEEQSSCLPDAVKVVFQGSVAKPGFHPKSVLNYYELYERPDLTDFVKPIFHCSLNKKFCCTVKPTNLREEFSMAELPEFTAPFLGKVAKFEEDGKLKWSAPLLKQIRAFSPSKVDMKDGLEAIKSYLSFFKTKSKIEPLSLYTSVCGSQINSLINARDNSKSLGPSAHYLYNMTKEQAFKPDGDSFRMDPRLVKDSEDWYAHFFAFDEPIRPIFVKASRKSEAKEKTKADKGDARIFSVGDLAFNLAFRRLMLPVIQHILSLPYESGVFGCLNAGSEEWTEACAFISKFGLVGESDQQTMDGHHKEMNYYYTKFIHDLSVFLGYTPTQARALSRAIKCTISYYMEVEGDWVYMDWRLNSGLPDTLIRNSVIGFLLVLVILSKRGNLKDTMIIKSNGKKVPVSEEVALMNVGDDHLCGMEKDLSKAYFSYGLIKEYSELGYALTRADKKPGEVSAQSIYVSTFLKRGFVEATIRGKRYVLAPLEIKSILKSICYSVDIPEDKLESRNRNSVLCAMNELFLHGPSTFNAYRNRIQPKVNFELPEYSKLEESFCNKKFELWVAEQEPDIQSLPKILSPDDGRSLANLVHQGDRHPNPNVNGSSTRGISSTTELNNNQITELQNEGTVAHLSSLTTETEVFSNSFQTTRRSPEEVSMAQFFKRPRLIGTLAVGVSGGVQYSAFPTYEAIPVVRKMLSQWRLFRGDLVVKVMLTGTSQACGKARLYAYPAPRVTDYGPPVLPFGVDAAKFFSNFTQSSQLPHIDMDLSRTGDYELKLGWPSSYDYLDIQGGMVDWYIMAVMVNHPYNADGSTFETIPMMIYASYENVVLQAVTNQGESGGNFSRGLRYAAYVAKHLPFAWANPFSKIADLGADVASHLGYSRLPEEVTKVVVSRLTDNVNVVEGQFDASQTLGLDEVALVSNARSPLSVPGECMITNIVKRKTQTVCGWVPARIMTVTPGVLVNLDYNNTAFTQMRMTPMSHLAASFDKWTGSIELCVEVVASPFVRGRLGVVIVPPSVAAPVAFPQDGSFLTTQFDVVGTTCIPVIVPYLYSTPFRDILMVPTADAVQPIVETRVCYFWLAGPYDMGATRAPDINLYMMAGPDFEFAMPDLAKANQYNLVTQGKTSLLIYGEEVESLAALSKRRTMLHTADFDGLTTLATWRTIQTVATDRTYPYEYWLSLPFHAISGSLSFLFRFHADTFVRVHEGKLGDETLAGPRSRGVIYADRGVIQVRVPDRCGAHFWTPFLAAPTLGVTSILALSGVVGLTPYDVLSSGGDDFTFSGYLCAPTITYAV